MLKELYTAAAGMMPQQLKLETTTNNIANAGTVGFKRQAIFKRALDEAEIQQYHNPGKPEIFDKSTGSYTDFVSGSFQETFNNLDIAINNKKGFFSVQDDKGKQFYTRAGNFTLSTEGNITTAEGKKLMGDSGPLTINKSSLDPLHLEDSKRLDIMITDRGDIFINHQLIGSVMVTEIENPETLKRETNSDFSKSDETKTSAIPPENISVKQGWLENSNVDIVAEMVQMIELQRLFELGSKVIHTNNETIDQSLKIGKIY